MPLLSDLQRDLIARLSLVGLEVLADRAQVAWSAGQPIPCALTPAERATMEGASLCQDFKTANRYARALRDAEEARMSSLSGGGLRHD